MTAAPDSQTPEPSEDDRPNAGPPELENLLVRMKRDADAPQDEGDSINEPPVAMPSKGPAGVDLAEQGQLRALASVLIIASLPAVLYGQDLRPPFNSAALAAGGGLFLVSAWLEWKLGQHFLLCACLGAGGVLIAKALAAL
ncbi:MAG: hypothetical protein ABI743_04405 [bacterium]